MRHVPHERAQPVLLRLDTALALALEPPPRRDARAEQQQRVRQQVMGERSVQELVAAHPRQYAQVYRRELAGEVLREQRADLVGRAALGEQHDELRVGGLGGHVEAADRARRDQRAARRVGAEVDAAVDALADDDDHDAARAPSASAASRYGSASAKVPGAVGLEHQALDRLGHRRAQQRGGHAGVQAQQARRRRRAPAAAPIAPGLRARSRDSSILICTPAAPSGGSVRAT